MVNSPKKKKGTWFIVAPVLILLGLGGLDYLISLIPKLVEDIKAPTSENVVDNIEAEQIVTPLDVIAILEKSNDSLPQYLTKKGWVQSTPFNDYREDREVVHTRYEYTLHTAPKYTITTWSDTPKTIIIYMANIYTYNKFATDIHHLDILPFLKKEYDDRYKNSDHFLISDNVFILNNGKIVALKKDQIIPIKSRNPYGGRPLDKFGNIQID